MVIFPMQLRNILKRQRLSPSHLVLVMLLGLFLNSPFTFGNTDSPQQFFRIKEVTQDGQAYDHLASLQNLVQEMTDKLLSLLHLELHVEVLPPPAEYNRVKNFGRWINEPGDQDCYNTRGKVLARDSETPITVDNRRGCTVKTGRWRDMFSGEEFENANQVQIDHTVPLKHAWEEGAAAWSPELRCQYANFLGNNFHLIPIRSHDNMSKGDNGPDQYLPPLEESRCQYLRNWLAIKLIWQLRISPEEKKAIEREVLQLNCDARMFTMTASELAEQRQKMLKFPLGCPKPPSVETPRPNIDTNLL
jgi:hypothetical protein